MATSGRPAAAQAALTDAGQRRWAELLGSLTGLLPPGTECVQVDGPDQQAGLFASRLAAELAARGRPVPVTADTGRAGDVTIFLRTAPGAADSGRHERRERADVVIDLHDTGWPVIRRVSAALAPREAWYLTETRAFFGCRAATWDAKFGDDLPAYRAAVAEAGMRPGGTAVDIGCGTGRALPPLRAAVGPAGRVIALDVTPEMLQVARPPAAVAGAALVLADARRLPFADGTVDAVFAAGLVNHLPDTGRGLRELARVTRPGGLLVLFHPTGRAALAARHGHSVSRNEPLAEGPLRRSTAVSGWQLTVYDDAAHRFFAVAERRQPGGEARARSGNRAG